jgi:hypothetical protein
VATFFPRLPTVRLLLNGWIRSLQTGASTLAFLRQRRQAPRLSPNYFRQISSDYHNWLEQQAQQFALPIVEPPPKVRRHEWVEPYYQRFGQQTGVAVILRCREGARVAVCYPKRGYLIEPAWRFVNLYYFYLQEPWAGCGSGCALTSPSMPKSASTAMSGWPGN